MMYSENCEYSPILVGTAKDWPPISPQPKPVDCKVVIIGSDNGIGIGRNKVEKIIRPFFTTKPAGQGCGLGLSPSYDIITEGHAAGVKNEYREGRVTTFYYYFTRLTL